MQKMAQDPTMAPPGCAACGEIEPTAAVGSVRLCWGCLERALWSLAGEPGARLRLYEFTGWMCVARDACDRIRADVRRTYAARYQAELWAARDPPTGTADEAMPESVSIVLSRYTRDRAQALADEAEVPLAAWIRQAIAWAFRATAVPVKKNGLDGE